MMLQKAKASHAVPTIRVQAQTKSGFALINASDFKHGKDELFDKKDKNLIAPPPQPDDADIASLKKTLAALHDELAEANSERDEWKARAEAAEAKSVGEKPKGK